jgi:MFS family permease
LLLNLSMPFYTVFVVGKLGLGVGDMVTLTTLASLGGLVTLTGWGRLSERFGNKPVLRVCASIWSLTAMTMWALVRPGWTWHLFAGYFIVGAMTAGFQLVQFNLMVRLAPGQLRPAYVAVFMALISIFSALGPIVGGQVLRHAPAEVFRAFGLPFFSFHLLFVAGALGCLLASLTLLRKVQEPAEKPVDSVWREMRTMKTFNPMLSVMSVGELLLTPRGLFALGQRSWRSVRQQVKAVGDVGSEILNGGREVFRRKNPDG